MKKHKMLLGISILILCLGFVSVSLSRVRRERAARSRVAAAIETATATSNKPPTATDAPAAPIRAAFLLSPLDIERLTSEADIIVIARVNSINGRRASLSVDKVVKGAANARTVDIELIADATGQQRVTSSQVGMFFLKTNAKGGYRVLDPDYPSVIAPPDAVVIDGSPVDRAVSIVGELLTKPNNVDVRREAVRVLSSARNERATELLREGSKAADPVVRMQSLSALVSRDDLGALETAEPILLHPPARIEQYLLDNLSAAVEGIKDPKAIPILQRLLSSSSSRTRVAAVASLRHMHISGAIEALVIALGDPNHEVRYEAVIGLAELTGQNQWAPAVDKFAQNEQRYLDHWKEWSRTR
jgi:hypothetical protein